MKGEGRLTVERVQPQYEMNGIVSVRTKKGRQRGSGWNRVCEAKGERNGIVRNKIKDACTGRKWVRNIKVVKKRACDLDL